MKSKDFLRSKGILSNDSDHYIIDFHDGREINLGDLLEEYAQQSQPSGMRCEPEFIEYINKSRAAFVKHIHGMKWDAKFRTAVDDLLICFDQMKNRLSESSPAGAAEGASEGMAEALRFAKWLADNDYRPGSGNKHWFKWNGMEVDENPLTIEQCYQIFASLSPGVEDGSVWVKVEDRLPENAGQGIVTGKQIGRAHV